MFRALRSQAISFPKPSCLLVSANQKTRGLWERDCHVLNQGTHAPWNRISWNLEVWKLIIPELRVLALTKRHVGSGNESGSQVSETTLPPETTLSKTIWDIIPSNPMRDYLLPSLSILRNHSPFLSFVQSFRQYGLCELMFYFFDLNFCF